MLACIKQRGKLSTSQFTALPFWVEMGWEQLSQALATALATVVTSSPEWTPTWNCEPNKPFLPQVAFDRLFYHNRKRNWQPSTMTPLPQGKVWKKNLAKDFQLGCPVRCPTNTDCLGALHCKCSRNTQECSLCGFNCGCSTGIDFFPDLPVTSLCKQDRLAALGYWESVRLAVTIQLWLLG